MTAGLCECGCGGLAPIATRHEPCKGYVKGEPRRFIAGHGGSKPLLIHEDPETNCWIWQRARSSNGYGQVFVNGKQVGAHCAMYEDLIGPIPDGLTLDHLCRTRACVNPGHLEPVTRGENVLRSPIARAAINARKTHCIRGHAFDEENTYINPKGQRQCRRCNRDRARQRKAAA